MLKRVLTIAIIMTGSVLLANAQTKDDFTPKEGDKSVSLNLGVGSFVGGSPGSGFEHLQYLRPSNQLVR